jgi:hypothetical protein
MRSTTTSGLNCFSFSVYRMYFLTTTSMSNLVWINGQETYWCIFVPHYGHIALQTGIKKISHFSNSSRNG